MLADRNRAALLLELLDGRVLPASELASRARISRSLASAHLRKLERSGLVAVEAHGRHRYYALARPELAVALEQLSALAPPAPRSSGLRAHDARASLSYARSCYDHLAGAVAVELARALEDDGSLVLRGTQFDVTDAGVERLARLGVDVDGAGQSRRAFARSCLDWTERRPHVAGALGAAILQRLLEQDWLRRRDGTRALAVTPAGADGLARDWGVSR